MFGGGWVVSEKGLISVLYMTGGKSINIRHISFPLSFLVFQPGGFMLSLCWLVRIHSDEGSTVDHDWILYTLIYHS